jgi:NTE family protein
VAGRSDHLVSNAGLRRWIEANLDLRDLEDASLAVHVVATDLETGKPVVISEGRALTALLASSAVPGLLPPVRLGGLSLVDGGVAADTPILQAVALGATEVVVLSSFQAGGFRGRDPRPAGLVWYAYEQVLAHWTVDHLGSDLGPGVVAYPVPLPDRDGRGPLDFSAGSQRIADAYRVTKEWLHLDSVELLHRPAVATARPLQLRSRRST